MAASYLHSNNRPKGVILLMTILLTIHLFVPFVSADGMSTCQANGGTCDDYSHSHDLTSSQQDWINGTYDFQLADTDTIELDMVWAIHEFNVFLFETYQENFTVICSRANHLHTKTVDFQARG